MAPFKRKGPVVAIEIGDEVIKVLRAEPAGGGVSLSQISLAETAEDGKAVVAFLSKAVGRVSRKVTVVACLPRSQVNLRMLELPSTDPAEIADMVDLQAGKQTPYSREEVLFDYKITGSPREGYSRVMLVIVQRSALRHHFNLFEEAGIDVDRMSVSSEGIGQWCNAALGTIPSNEAVAVLDVDSESSDLIVVSGGAVVFTRNLRIGARQLQQDRGGAARRLAREIRQSLAAYSGDGDGPGASRLVLTGAGFGLEDTAQRLEEDLQFAVDRKNSLSPARKLPESIPMRDERFGGVSIAALLGIALAAGSLELDLMPDPVRMRRDLTARAHTLASFGMLVMAVLMALSMLAVLKLMTRYRETEELVNRSRRLDPRVEQVDRMDAVVKAVRARRALRETTFNILEALHPLVPRDVLLDSVARETAARSPGRITLRGVAGTRQDIRLLVNRLEQSPLFRDVQESGTRMDRVTGKFTFQVQCRIEEEEA